MPHIIIQRHFPLFTAHHIFPRDFENQSDICSPTVPFACSCPCAAALPDLQLEVGVVKAGLHIHMECASSTNIRDIPSEQELQLKHVGNMLAQSMRIGRGKDMSGHFSREVTLLCYACTYSTWKPILHARMLSSKSRPIPGCPAHEKCRWYMPISRNLALGRMNGLRFTCHMQSCRQSCPLDQMQNCRSKTRAAGRGDDDKEPAVGFLAVRFFL